MRYDALLNHKNIIAIMSPQIIELLIFAAIAFFLINKLISILGSTNENDELNKSFFGEPFGMKDVTQKFKVLKKIDGDYANNDIIDEANKRQILEKLPIINTKLQNFDLAKFVKGSISAFSMLTSNSEKEDKDLLENLVDKRFIEEFASKVAKYYEYNSTSINAKVTDLYLFGNNVFIKVLFTNKTKKLRSIWTFSKNSNDNNRNWFLSNIEEPNNV